MPTTKSLRNPSKPLNPRKCAMISLLYALAICFCQTKKKKKKSAATPVPAQGAELNLTGNGEAEIAAEPRVNHVKSPPKKAKAKEQPKTRKKQQDDLDQILAELSLK